MRGDVAGAAWIGVGAPSAADLGSALQEGSDKPTWRRRIAMQRPAKPPPMMRTSTSRLRAMPPTLRKDTMAPRLKPSSNSMISACASYGNIAAFSPKEPLFTKQTSGSPEIGGAPE